MEATGMDAWIEREVLACPFPDHRLERRFSKILSELSWEIGESLPVACQDWAGTKAAYRFLDNPRVDESIILAGHFQATRLRFARSPGMVLVLHDTTEFSYQRVAAAPIGKTGKTFVGRRGDGRPRMHTVCGLLMHSSLVVTRDGVPLGLAAVKFWTRKKFKGVRALRQKVNLTRLPIEQKESFRWVENVRRATEQLGDPGRCVHIGDRESDIFELFCEADRDGSYFLVRTCADRLAQDGLVTVSDEMGRQDVCGLHRVQVQDRHGHTSDAELHVRFCRMNVLPPIGKQKRYPNLSLTAIYAQETKAPNGRDRIEWKLLTNLPVANFRDAVEKLDWYLLRWKIETYHKILKSGCKAEESKLRTAQRLTNLLAIYCILAWRVFWLCMVNRQTPDAPASLVFTATELDLLDHITKHRPPARHRTVSHYLNAVARLGGYLSRRSDAPPGNMVLWRGLSRLTDMHLGFTLAYQLVGN
jgi:hypothetical protein